MVNILVDNYTVVNILFDVGITINILVDIYLNWSEYFGWIIVLWVNILVKNILW